MLYPWHRFFSDGIQKVDMFLNEIKGCLEIFYTGTGIDMWWEE